MQREVKVSRTRYYSALFIIFILVVLLVKCYSTEIPVLQLTQQPKSSRSPSTSPPEDTPIPSTSSSSKSQVQKVFENIYDKKLWGEYGGGSGHGSLVNSTVQIRAKLKAFIEEHNITSMMDIPCGSMAWMPLLLRQLGPNFRYFGADVAGNVVERNRQTYKNQTNWIIRQLDVTSTPLPKGYDMLFTRQALQHLPNALILKYFENVKSSSVKYLVVENNRDTKMNRDIGIGEYRKINLRLPPFNLCCEIQKPLTEEFAWDGTPVDYEQLVFSVDEMTYG